MSKNKNSVENSVKAIDNAMNASIKDLTEMEKNTVNDQAETIIATSIEMAMEFVEVESDLIAHASQAKSLNEEEMQLREAIAKAMQAKGLVSVSASLRTMEAARKEKTVLSEVAKRITALCNCHEKGKSYTVKTSDLADLTTFKKVKDTKGNVNSVRNTLESEVGKAVQYMMKDTQGKVDKWTGKIEMPSDSVDYTLSAPSNRNGNRLVIHFQD